MAPLEPKRIGALLALVAVAATPAFASAELGTFTDAELPDTAWTVAELLDDTVGNDAELTGLHLTAGGNPGGFRAVTNSWIHDGTDWATVVAGHLRAEADFEPLTDGPLGQVDVAVDVVTSQTTYLTEAMLSFFPVLRQGETYYAAGQAVDSSGGWATAQWLALESADFTPYAGDLQGPSHPDFTAAGEPLTFGVAVQSGPHQLAGAFFTEGGLDNWSLTLSAPDESGGAGGAGGSSSAGGSGGTTGAGAGQGVGASGLGVGPSALPPRDDGGCGCRVAPSSNPSTNILISLAVSLALLTRHRRRRGAQTGRVR